MALEETISKILFKSILDQTGYTQEQLMDNGPGTRINPLPIIRAVFIVIMLEQVEITLAAVGEMINRDHATVSHCKKNHRVKMMRIKGYRDLYKRIHADFTFQKDRDLKGVSLQDREAFLTAEINRLTEMREEVHVRILEQF